MVTINVIGLEWNVYITNFNTKRIIAYNIFNHYGFWVGCAMAYKDWDDRKKFEKEVQNELMYYFRSKCEWEIILSSWPPYKEFNDEKVSVYDQVMLNWDKFIEYLWSNRHLLDEFR